MVEQLKECVMMSMTQSLIMKMMMELSQFACPEQMPLSSEDQLKHGRGRPRKPKSPDTGDKPKHGRGRPHEHTPTDTDEKPKCGRGRPPSVKILPLVVMHPNQRSPKCITHVVLHSHR